MNARDCAVWNAAIEAARQIALTAAVLIEVYDDAQAVLQQAATAALTGFTEGLRALAQPTQDPPCPTA